MSEAMADETRAEGALGAPVPGWTPPPHPQRSPMTGGRCVVAPVEPNAHADPLHAAYSAEGGESGWTYLPYGPFRSGGAFRRWMETSCRRADPLFHAVLDAEGAPVGLASYLRITPEAGAIEIGHIHFSPALRRTPAATEALYMMIRRAFDLGYRRCEWKCDALNAASRRAAERLGFAFEGVHRQAAVVKGRNRDTAWYSIIDREWPPTRVAFESWLDASNFDEAERQVERLGVMIAEARAEMLAP